jgi:L-iditol 2-dehydrogenase
VNHVSTVYKIPGSISFEEASLVTTAGCPLYGIESAGGMLAGDTVLVIGPGPIGLMSVQVAKALGAGKVFLTGTRNSRLNLGKKLGADEIINVQRQDPFKKLMQFTGDSGVNIAIECSGTEEGLNLAFETVRKAGKIILLGFPHKPVKVKFDSIVRNNIHIFGVRGEGMANCQRALALMAEGKIKAKPLITHLFPLTEVRKALDVFANRRGGAIKVILKPNECANFRQTSSEKNYIVADR